MNKRVECGLARFKEGFSCSASVCAAMAPEFGLSEALALKAACAFGGGMGRQGETCGAISGAIIVIGLAAGSATPGDKTAKDNAYKLVRDMVKEFKASHNATDCRDLLGCDISTPEGSKNAREKNLFTTECPKYVQSAIEITTKLLNLPD